MLDVGFDLGRLPAPETEWHAPRDFAAVDHRIQRRLDTNRVNRLRAEWNPDMVGIFWLSRREDGSLWTLDGQHRGRTLIDRGEGDIPRECKVYDGLTPAQEARLFYGLNSYLRVSAADQFRARAMYEDPVALEIMRIVEKHGLQVDKSVADGNIVCVAALEAVYSGRVARKEPGAYPAVLSATLGTLIQAFGTTTAAVGAELVKGLGIILHDHIGTVQPADLARKMAIRPAGATGLLSAARAHKANEGGTTASAVAHCVTLDYNKGRSSGRLPLRR